MARCSSQKCHVEKGLNPPFCSGRRKFVLPTRFPMSPKSSEREGGIPEERWSMMLARLVNLGLRFLPLG